MTRYSMDDRLPDRPLDPPEPKISDADANRIEQRLEELARDEAESRKGPFDEWLADYSAEDIAFIIASLIEGTQDSTYAAAGRAESIRDDYIAWRIADPRLREQAEADVLDTTDED